LCHKTYESNELMLEEKEVGVGKGEPAFGRMPRVPEHAQKSRLSKVLTKRKRIEQKDSSPRKLSLQHNRYNREKNQPGTHEE